MPPFCHCPTPPRSHLLSVQRGVSGIRRYISFRRKGTKARLGPAEADPDVDHRKSTNEETHKKVSGWGLATMGCRVLIDMAYM